mmetsp:Transcript_38398/g.118654  ORF Transcript_38398/g.118654 Transcript_38398/m.118654 type:complete len:250 (-) Transcript_38398:1609-2358(-)
MTRPHVWSHFISHPLKKLSQMICAPLAKSANCASQMFMFLGLRSAYPTSKPRTPYSLRELFVTVKRACSSDTFSRYVCVSSVFWSCTTAWRCEKVARSTSWPEMRIGKPSCSSVPKARASAVPHSMPTPLSRDSARFCMMPCSVLCSAKPCGRLLSAEMTGRSAASLTVVGNILASSSSGMKSAHSGLTHCFWKSRYEYLPSSTTAHALRNLLLTSLWIVSSSADSRPLLSASCSLYSCTMLRRFSMTL